MVLHQLIDSIFLVFARVGMVDSESADWFREHEQRPITFEKRIKEIMLPIMDEAGIGGNVKPDLIVFGSLFWDEVFLTEVSKAGQACELRHV